MNKSVDVGNKGLKFIYIVFFQCGDLVKYATARWVYVLITCFIKYDIKVLILPKTYEFFILKFISKIIMKNKSNHRTIMIIYISWFFYLDKYIYTF